MSLDPKTILQDTLFWLWSELHTWAYCNPEPSEREKWVTRWSNKPLCPKCKMNLNEFLENDPIDTTPDVFLWSIRFHKYVTERFGKNVSVVTLHAVWLEHVLTIRKIAAEDAV